MGQHFRHVESVVSANDATYLARQAVEASAQSGHGSEVAVVSLH